MNPRYLLFHAALIAGLALAAGTGRADDAAVPGSGYPASRYETLWTQSPFAASTEEGAGSADFALVGIAQFDHVAYASLIDKHTMEHFLVTSDQPARGFTLVSVKHGGDPTASFAVLQKDGQSLTLKLETAPPPTQGPPGGGPPGADGTAAAATSAMPTGAAPPHVHIHRIRVVVPPPPAPGSN